MVKANGAGTGSGQKAPTTPAQGPQGVADAEAPLQRFLEGYEKIKSELRALTYEIDELLDYVGNALDVYELDAVMDETNILFTLNEMIRTFLGAKDAWKFHVEAVRVICQEIEDIERLLREANVIPREEE